MAMNIYLVTQTKNQDYGTYDSFICYAKTEEDARNMTPEGKAFNEFRIYSWCSNQNHANVKFIGISEDADKEEVILASFNAG